MLTIKKIAEMDASSVPELYNFLLDEDIMYDDNRDNWFIGIEKLRESLPLAPQNIYDLIANIIEEANKEDIRIIHCI